MKKSDTLSSAHEILIVRHRLPSSEHSSAAKAQRLARKSGLNRRAIRAGHSSRGVACLSKANKPFRFSGDNQQITFRAAQVSSRTVKLLKAREEPRSLPVLRPASEEVPIRAERSGDSRAAPPWVTVKIRRLALKERNKRVIREIVSRFLFVSLFQS